MTRIPTLISRTVLVVVGVLATAGLAAAAEAIHDRGAGAPDVRSIVVGPPESALVGDLHPGGSGALNVQLTNPNSVPMIVTRLEPSGGNTARSSVTACDAGGSPVRVLPQRRLSIELAPGMTRTVSLPGAVTMSREARDACQGATFVFEITASAVAAS